jgi:hypothetical protein
VFAFVLVLKAVTVAGPAPDTPTMEDDQLKKKNPQQQI